MLDFDGDFSNKADMLQLDDRLSDVDDIDDGELDLIEEFEDMKELYEKLLGVGDNDEASIGNKF